MLDTQTNIDYSVHYPPPPDMPNALCQFTDPEIFFPVSRKEYEEGDRLHEKDISYATKLPSGKAIKPLDTAKSMCMTCDHLIPCRDYAVINAVAFGVWGGTTARERMTLRRLIYGREPYCGEETA